MTDAEKLIAELAARFLVAHIEKYGLTGDSAYANRALADARQILKGAAQKDTRP